MYYDKICQAAAYYIRHDLWHVNYGRGIIPPFHFVRRYNLTRENCIFFDDREENVAAAIECGIRAVRVTGRAMLAEALDKLLAGEEPA